MRNKVKHWNKYYVDSNIFPLVEARHAETNPEKTNTQQVSLRVQLTGTNLWWQPSHHAYSTIKRPLVRYASSAKTPPTPAPRQKW